ncbi:MAG: peptidase C45 [Planctomycetaceae bacterium]|nr:peptidase C45 [Planctomycetaceae bacterium]
MTPPLPPRYPEITVCGPPRELGRQLGEAAREQVRGFCEIALDRVNQTVRISRERATGIAQQSLVCAEAYRPDLVQELRGTAEAAGVSLDDLMLLQVRNQLTPDDSACTSLAIQSPDGMTTVAQTWDNDPVLDEFTIVLTRRPVGQPATLMCTQAGLISYMGLSETGIGTCVNTLPAPARSVGVPHYFILREMYEARQLQDAVQSVRRASRAIPVNIMMATPEGPADLEVTLDEIHVLKPENGRSWLGHSNHCLCPEIAAFNDQFPELIQSHSRKDRIDQLLSAAESTWRSASETGRRQILEQILKDHEGHPRSICRHANKDPAHGFWATVFALIVEPFALRMHVARGTPCCSEFEEYSLG